MLRIGMTFLSDHIFGFYFLLDFFLEIRSKATIWYLVLLSKAQTAREKGCHEYHDTSFHGVTCIVNLL